MSRWDAFVSSRTSTVTDLPAWGDVVRNAYGIEPHFLMVEEGGDVTAALALYEVRHRLFGHYLTTAAFATDGGVYFENEAARERVLDEAVMLAKSLNVDYLVLRHRGPAIESFDSDTRYGTAVLDLEPGQERVWNEILPGKTRNQVRRGSKEGYVVRSGNDQLPGFFDVFHRHMRDLGSPAHSRSFYENILRFLPDHVHFLTVRDGNAVVAGAMVLEVNGVSMNIHTVSLRSHNRRCPNYLLYWTMIEEACRRGNRWFDMGRSEMDGPNMRFKMNWGVSVVPLHYDYLLNRIDAIPAMDPRDSKYRLATNLWKRLPVGVTSRLGPWLIKGIA